VLERDVKLVVPNADSLVELQKEDASIENKEFVSDQKLPRRVQNVLSALTPISSLLMERNTTKNKLENMLLQREKLSEFWQPEENGEHQL